MKKLYFISKEIPGEADFAETVTAEGYIVPKLYTTKKEAIKSLKWLQACDDTASYQLDWYDANAFEYQDDDVLNVILKMILK